jgi:hypothetical protein
MSILGADVARRCSNVNRGLPGLEAKK